MGIKLKMECLIIEDKKIKCSKTLKSSQKKYNECYEKLKDYGTKRTLDKNTVYIIYTSELNGKK